ncbi:hypothetical protein D3C85_1214770 [compost metagenome]
MRIEGDQGADSRRPAQGRAARVQHALLLGEILGVAPLTGLVGIVPHEEIPAHGGVFAGMGLHDRHVVVGAGVIVSGFQQQDAEARLDQIGGQGAAAGAGADDDEVVSGLGSPVWACDGHTVSSHSSACSRRAMSRAA